MLSIVFRFRQPFSAFVKLLHTNVFPLNRMEKMKKSSFAKDDDQIIHELVLQYSREIKACLKHH